MTIAKIEGAPAPARWSARIALFSLVLLATAILLHRFFGMATPVFLRLLVLAFAGAGLAIVIGMVMAARIWRDGGAGTARLVVAFTVAGGILGWPIAVLPITHSLPELNDVTTSREAPPAFEALAALRKPPANPVEYPAQRFAALQAEQYPDIATLAVNRSVAETYDLVLEAVRRERMAVAREQPPTAENDMTGSIEAIDRTLVIGFYDDVAVRVVGSEKEARVDIRSASRFGRHDFGRNVHRVRALLRGIVARLESTIPGGAGERGQKARGGRPLKPGAGKDAAKEADRKKAAPRQ